MLNEYDTPRVDRHSGYSRRQFLGGTLAVAAATSLLDVATSPAAGVRAVDGRKIKIGLVGCGGRGSWIADLFRKHGGYQFHSVADYFPDSADQRGKALGVDTARRFFGLSAYEKLIHSGVEAVLLQTPPYFFPEHAAAAVDAGLHVYMAKPLAVDVPGCRRVEAAGKLATKKQRVFFVDYQLPTDPVNIRVAQRIWNGELGTLAKLVTIGITGGHANAPKTGSLESRLRNQLWENDIALSGDYILVYDIHAIDGALWVAGQRPVAAIGASRICRPDAHGDAHGVCSVIYEYGDGLVHEHSGLALPNGEGGALSCTIYGPKAHAIVTYWHKAHFHIRGQKEYTAEVVDLYAAGAARNIASFYNAVCANDVANPTLPRAIDGCLACILGREAAARRTRLTMDQLLEENKRLEVDLSGLRA